MGADEMRTRSFRYEDYRNRRAFLRSYPLHWGDDEHNEDETPTITNKTGEKKPVKKMVLSLFQWGGETILVLRRFKHKVTLRVIACIPIHFKHTAALLPT